MKKITIFHHHFGGNIFGSQIQVIEGPFGKKRWQGLLKNSQYFHLGLIVLLGSYDSHSIHVWSI